LPAWRAAKGSPRGSVRRGARRLPALPDAARRGALVGDLDGSRKLLVGLVRNLARNRRRLAVNARPHVSDEVGLVEDALPGAESCSSPPRSTPASATASSASRTCSARVVTLRMLDGASGDEVANILGISRGHVAVLLHRAKAKLLACMTPVPPCRHPRENHEHRD
jgi:RNA polymerase sigma-70 factor (ECF subfamily)